VLAGADRPDHGRLRRMSGSAPVETGLPRGHAPERVLRQVAESRPLPDRIRWTPYFCRIIFQAGPVAPSVRDSPARTPGGACPHRTRYNSTP
jgi:hypothetical protein